MLRLEIEFDESSTEPPTRLATSLNPAGYLRPMITVHLNFRPYLYFASIAFSVLVDISRTPQSVTAETWSQFRGPSGDGKIDAKPLPTSWTPDRGVKWLAPLPGLGWSSPIVIDDKIYLTSAVASTEDSRSLEGSQSLRLQCIDLESGRLVFDKEIFQQSAMAPQVHSKNSHASPTPIFDGERLYVHFGHQGTAAVDLDGNILWSNRDHMFPPTHGNGGSPIIVDGMLVFTCDGGEAPYTLALDCRTGREVWKTPRDVPAERKFSFCTPSYFVIDGRPQIISPGSNIVQSLDPTTGKVLWFVRYDGYSVIPKPIYHQGLIFVCTGYGPTTLFAIDPTGSGDVTDSHVRWKYERQTVPKTPSLIGYQKVVILCSDRGVAVAVDAISGNEAWTQRLGGNYSASPLLVGKRIYFQSEQGEGSLWELNDDGTQAPEQIGTSNLPGRTFASYAVVGQDVLVRAESGLYRISGE